LPPNKTFLKNMKKLLSNLMEWIRPAGIGVVYFLAEYLHQDAVSKFHLLGPWVVVIMSGTVALESLFLGEAGAEKIGYQPNRAYQIQSGLSNLATALTALLVFVLDWGRYADATVVIVMLLFFTFSAVNHAATAIRGHNWKPVNLMRPILTLLLLGVLVPPMIRALTQKTEPSFSSLPELVLPHELVITEKDVQPIPTSGDNNPIIGKSLIDDRSE
jgi:hypothetical protein